MVKHKLFFLFTSDFKKLSEKFRKQIGESISGRCLKKSSVGMFRARSEFRNAGLPSAVISKKSNHGQKGTFVNYL